jgi:hypothetical protein
MDTKMRHRIARTGVDEARDDLKNRTLALVPGSLSRLIYLASLRDYNTGRYYHEGLARRFSEEVATEAMASSHREAFQNLLRCSLAELVGELERYVGGTPTEANQVLHTWERLEPYRVAVPAETHPVLAEFFVSNVRVALAILKHRRSEGL